MGCKQGSKGFTLIELVVTVSILGMLTLIIVPFSVEAIGRFELERAARMIAGDIRYGESKALTEQSDSYRIQFLTASNSYRKYFNKNNSNSYVLVKMPERITLSGAVFGKDNPRVSFNMRGTVQVGGSVALTDNYGNWMTIKVTPVTGRVSVERTNTKK